MITIGFFGTPELASCILDSFLKDQGYTVAFVVTNPDAPQGRKQTLTETPVKKRAREDQIPVFTPEKIRNNTEFLETIRAFSVDYIIVVAYGKILPREILELPGKMCVNVHFSLLPKYRGASPIQSALLHGEKETGMTIMKMNEKMDEGDIIFQEKIMISKRETSGTLFAKFCDESSNVVTNIIKKLHAGELEPMPQDHTQATYVEKIAKTDGLVDWTKNAEDIYHRWQAFTPWPGIFTFLDGKRLLLEEVTWESGDSDALPGTIFQRDDTIEIACGEGVLIPKRLKLEGKTSQTLEEFRRGHQNLIGKHLG